jgi:alpha-1,2-mannosyltransferase
VFVEPFLYPHLLQPDGRRGLSDKALRPRQRRISFSELLPVVLIFTVAFLARLSPTLRGSGLYGLNFYDDGVHYAAATGFVHGRLPYRDFLLLHPPGIVLALTPFALLAHWVGDAQGFALARVSFMLLGAGNALLVARFLRPVGTFAAWFGGLFYAVFWPAVYSEHTVLLEGLANTCLLVALLLISAAGSAERPTATRVVVAGGLLGVAASIKIWGVLPVLLLFGCLLFSAGIRRALLFLVGAGVGATLVCLPFFVMAPGAMWRMVVLDQLQRQTTPLPAVERLNEIMGLALLKPPDHLSVALVVALTLLLLACVAAWLRASCCSSAWAPSCCRPRRGSCTTPG